VAYNPCDDLNCNEGICYQDGNFGETATCVCGAENHGTNCEIAYNDCDLDLCGLEALVPTTKEQSWENMLTVVPVIPVTT
jgi:hypothetical protein